MSTEETHALGYERVDDDPNTSALLATMDATARWEATLQLREWERHQLRFKRGQRLHDVGCGLGDAALALAADLGEPGELVGIDVSNEMVSVARSRATPARCQARFSVGDTVALDEPDGYFDVVRSTDDGAEAEHQVSVSLMDSLTDPDKAYEVHRLLSLMAELADGSGSHVQMTVKMVVPESGKDQIIEQATKAGAQQATSTEL